MFRILSLDGGGIKGTFTASVLAHLEESTGKRVLDHFDLIVGTSTGGILAIGLGLGFTGRDLLEFYRREGPAIFPGTSLVARSAGFLKQLFVGPKFSGTVLRDALAKVLDNKRFGESRCRLVVPSYDAVYGRIYLFKTAHHPRFLE